jgi:hypothetical protein
MGGAYHNEKSKLKVGGARRAAVLPACVSRAGREAMKRETWAGGLLLVAIAFALVMLYHNQPDNSAPQPPVVEKARPPSTFEGETPSLEIPALGTLPDPDSLGVPESPPSDSRLAPLASRLSACPFALEVTYEWRAGVPVAAMPLEELEAQIRAWRAGC